MGYKLTRLANLPLDSTVRLYIFVIGESAWNGGLEEIVHKNFDNLAANIGAHSIIVEGLNPEFRGDVVEKYLGTTYHELSGQLPALLLTDTHPDELTADSMRILISLRMANARYEIIEDFLRDVAAFARRESDLLRRLEAGSKVGGIFDDVVKLNLPIVPGFVGVNVNNALKHLRKWWDQDPVMLPPLTKI